MRVATEGPARSGISRNQSLPTAAQVPFDVPDWMTPDNRRRAAAIYDHVRERLIRARVDYRASVLVLASLTENREADFLTEEQFSHFGPPASHRRWGRIRSGVGDRLGYYPDIEQSVIVRAMEDLRQLYDWVKAGAEAAARPCS
jgi:hypothetical protein